MLRKPKIISITECIPPEDGSDGTYSIRITERKLRQIAEWAQEQVNWHYSGFDGHINVDISAVDELQAYNRFMHLWDCLPKKEEEA